MAVAVSLRGTMERRRASGPDRGATLMSTNSKRVKKTTVVLLRPGVGKQDFDLSAGATLGDLFRAANVDRENQEILIDGKLVEDVVVLQPGTVVSIVTRPRNPSSAGSWREGIGTLHDDPVFREVVEAIEMRREAEKDRS
jgi:hypothetical protein